MSTTTPSKQEKTPFAWSPFQLVKVLIYIISCHASASVNQSQAQWCDAAKCSSSGFEISKCIQAFIDKLARLTLIWILRIGGQQCYPGLHAPTHLHVACGTVVDRPTQLVCMSDIHFLISICICQHTNTKDIGGQSASDTAHWIATFAQVQIVEPCLSVFVVHQRL